MMIQCVNLTGNSDYALDDLICLYHVKSTTKDLLKIEIIAPKTINLKKATCLALVGDKLIERICKLQNDNGTGLRC